MAVETHRTRSLRQKLRDLRVELRARRVGRQAMPLHHDLSIAARGVLGVTGSGTSSAWDRLAEGGTAYSRSLEPSRIPPSLFVSERDRVRHGMAMPLSERCIEDFGRPADSTGVEDWDLDEFFSDDSH